MSTTNFERFHQDNTIPSGPGWIWVFGSNLKGAHGKGAAKVAHVSFGAAYGEGVGRTGNAYAIPTKFLATMDPRHVLPLEDIERNVRVFIAYAEKNPALKFFVTAVGTGLSGLADEQVAPMFAGAPANCSLPMQWRQWVEAPEPELAQAAGRERERIAA